MNIRDLISRDAVITDLRGGQKQRVLETLGERAATMLDLDPKVVIQALLTREQLGSTGMGGGAAIPHARFPQVLRPRALFARLWAPVDFEAIDGHSVDIVCVLLLPSEGERSEPLRALASVAKRFRNPELLARMRRAPDARALYEILVEPTSS